MINSEKELTQEECLNLFLYKKLYIDKVNNLNYIISDEYNKAIFDEKLIKKYNLDNKEILNKWKNNHVKIVNYFKYNFKVQFKPKVIHWNDRKKTNYFENKLQEGYEYQEYIKEVFAKDGIILNTFSTKEEQYKIGETQEGVEIKYDSNYKKTNNLFIEILERRDTSILNWTQSALLKNDNTKLYLIGDNEKYWIFKKNDLLKIFGNLRCNWYKLVMSQTSTSIGFLFPCDKANEISINKEEVFNIINLNKK